MEVWRCGCGDLEMWKCVNVEMCRCGSVNVEMWRCVDVEMWRFGVKDAANIAKQDQNNSQLML